jgi:hypothetical protein
LVVAFFFSIMFKHKHSLSMDGEIKH